MDYSRFNPYDALIRPFEALLNSLDEQDKLNPQSDFLGEAGQIQTAFEEAVFEFLEPYISESIALATLRDILPGNAGGRTPEGGRTQSGAVVYREPETRMKKLRTVFGSCY